MYVYKREHVNGNVLKKPGAMKIQYINLLGDRECEQAVRALLCNSTLMGQLPEGYRGRKNMVRALVELVCSFLYICAAYLCCLVVNVVVETCRGHNLVRAHQFVLDLLIFCIGQIYHYSINCFSFINARNYQFQLHLFWDSYFYNILTFDFLKLKY